MITLYKNEKTYVQLDGTYVTVELRGLSTDTKPTEIYGKKIDNGSTFIEIDTGDIYFYDLENKEWKEV